MRKGSEALIGAAAALERPSTPLCTEAGADHGGAGRAEYGGSARQCVKPRGAAPDDRSAKASARKGSEALIGAAAALERPSTPLCTEAGADHGGAGRAECGGSARQCVKPRGAAPDDRSAKASARKGSEALICGDHSSKRFPGDRILFGSSDCLTASIPW